MVLRKTLAIVLSIAIGAVTLEVSARLVERAGFLSNRFPGSATFPWLQFDPYLLWRNRPNYVIGGTRVALDASGWRITYRNPTGKKRVLCVGDSGVFGVYRQAGDLEWDCWPDSLARACPEVNVVNKSALGYSSWHVLRLLLDDSFKYDAVFVRVGWNDHAREVFAKQADAESIVAQYLARFAVGRILLASSIQPVNTEPRQSVLIESFRKNLHTISALCRNRGVPLYFVDYPVGEIAGKAAQEYADMHAGVVGNTAELVEMHGRYRREIEAVGTSVGRFVPLHLSPTCFNKEDPIHPNREGVYQIARECATALTADGIVSIVEDSGLGRPVNWKLK